MLGMALIWCGCAEKVKRKNNLPGAESVDVESLQEVSPPEASGFRRLADCSRVDNPDSETLSFRCEIAETITEVHLQGILYDGSIRLIEVSDYDFASGSGTFNVSGSLFQGVEEVLMVGRREGQLTRGLAIGIQSVVSELQFDRGPIYAFVTEAMAANLKGFEGADLKCNEVANDNQFSGRWRALTYPEFWGSVWRPTT